MAQSLSLTPRFSPPYKVRNGDCDWTIAHKNHLTVHQLHLANPQIDDWDAWPNGLVLHVPSSTSVANTAPKTLVAKAETHTAIAANKISTRKFVVTGDDNDWVIAHHLGDSLHLIHQLNPDVEWSRLRPGKHILVPANDDSNGELVADSGSKKSGHTKIKRIRGRYAVINSDAVAIRREAGQHAHRITAVDTGTRVVVLDRDGAWYKLRFPRGTEGWVRGDFLNAAKAPPVEHRRRQRNEDDSETRVATRRVTRRHRGHTPEQVVALDTDQKANPILKTAVAMRGTRYSYGSSSRSATDCSGYTWQVYGSHGIHLPRTSREQSQVGQAVKTGDLKPGDLVFFGSREGRGVHHVGIYVGKGKFIHASSGGGKVQYNSLGDDYYHNHYITARRVMKSSRSKSKHMVASHHESHPSAVSEASADTNATPISASDC